MRCQTRVETADGLALGEVMRIRVDSVLRADNTGCANGHVVHTAVIASESMQSRAPRNGKEDLPDTGKMSGTPLKLC
jgi:hypothetical protein